MRNKCLQLTARGVRARDLLTYDTFYLLDHFLGRRLVNLVFGGLRHRTRDRFLSSLRHQQGQTFQVARIDPPNPSDFIRNYLTPGRPVVISRGACDWECTRKWSLDYLSQLCGNDRIVLLPKHRTTDGFAGTREFEKVEETSFARFVADLKQDSGKYLRFSTIVEDYPELMADLDLNWLSQFYGPLCLGKRIHSFIGAAGSRTRLHCDFPPNLFVQVQGRKHWILFHPNYRAVIDPLLERSSLSFTTNLEVRLSSRQPNALSHHMDRYETILEPGDILFNPAYMWHDVVNLSDSIGVSIRWLSPGIHYRAAWIPQILNLFATNPPIWQAGLSRRDINKDLLSSKNNAKRDSTYLG